MLEHFNINNNKNILGAKKEKNNQKSVNSGCADVEMRVRFLRLKTLPFWHPAG